MSTFDRDFKKASKLVVKASEKAIRGTAIELFSEVIRRTPVGNPSLWKSRPPVGYVGGRLRGNWQTNIGAPIRNEIERVDPSGSAAAGEAVSKAKQMDIDDTIYLSNNLPYSEAVEMGSSKQAPQGMVRRTVKQFNDILEKQAKRNKI